MNNVTEIYKGKQPRRPHFVQDWAELRGYKKAVDLAKALDADKSLVSRWYSGSTPNEEYQGKLAALFHCERESIFRHPDDDWVAKFFRDRTDQEIARIKMMLEAAFPLKTGTGG